MKYSLLVLLFGVIAFVASQPTFSLDITSFDSAALSSWQLNGNTAGLNPNGGNVLELTSAGGSETGTAFLTSPIPLINKLSFSAAFSFQILYSGGIGDEDGPGADGITFAMNSLTNSYGQNGDGMGYGGMPQSVAVEFDTFNNGYPIDINGNHVGIDLNGNIQSATSAAYGTRMNDGNIHYAWVDYDGVNQMLTARISNNNVRPIDAFVALNVNLQAILQSSNVFVGFTSGTGAGWGQHDILAFSFVNSYQPIGQITTGVPVFTTGVVTTGAFINANSCPFFDVDSVGFGLVVDGATISFTDFNMIAFGNFNGNTGDIEGRLAVGGNLILGNGFSIGYTITDISKDAFSLVVSGNANWGSGALYPVGSSAYVGGTFTAPSYLLLQQVAASGSLSTFFANAQAAYTVEANLLATELDNVAQLVVYGALTLTCNDATAKNYFVTVDTATINAINDWQTVGCNADAEWLINVPDSTVDVTFTGNNFPVTGVVYNIQGSGRTINVKTSVAGSILSPNNNLNQSGGTIYGKVVVNNVVNCLQTNVPTCPIVGGFGSNPQ